MCVLKVVKSDMCSFISHYFWYGIEEFVFCFPSTSHDLLLLLDLSLRSDLEEIIKNLD